ncbi:insulinase family protein [Catenovulum sp. 2E275]|uniref:insulinase family protein n=1 Tax=Catenovulum sp. 2E275 TaxID=2980497 RepID=UPI0021D0C45B|nr:insulinase family protein [Catenovulum sp. 2E275]MCU4674809.1 insulinase family protein [Catenovulum sp. 2E275]
MTIQTKNYLANFKSGKLDNGLSLLAIQTEHKKAGVAMAVKAGNYQDPPQHLGLAHFLEHLLFLGSEKSPDEGFHAFIEKNGGKCNAWTSLEHSNFFYEISPDLLTKSLEKFSELFTCPLFSTFWIEKEIESLDAEFHLKVNDEIRRLHEVHKETSNPDHPFSRFTSGNKSTLNAPAQELQEALFDFFQQNYVGHNLALVIVTPSDYEQTFQTAKTYFDKVSSSKPKDLQYPERLYLPEQLGTKIAVHSDKVENRMILSFPMPSEAKTSLAKSLTYFTCLFGHEGYGSLLSGLKNLNYVTSLTASGGLDNGFTQDFNLSLQLTEHGINHLDDLCQEIFGYINFIKTQSYQSHIYTEKQKLSSLANQYQETGKAIDLASQLALKLHYYTAEFVFSADYVMSGMDLTWLEQAYQSLVPDNTRLVLVTNQPEQPYLSEHYQVPYNIIPISEETKATWLNATCQQTYQLPDPNPYLPNPQKINKNAELFDKKPQKIINEQASTIWFKQDQRSNAPYGHIYISLDLPNSQGNRKKIAMTRLFIEMFMDDIAEENYPALAAGLHYQISPHQAGMTIHISGYSEKQPDFTKQLLKQLRLRRFTKQKYLSIKQATLTSWHNNRHIKPANQLFKQLTYMLQNNQYAYPDLADSIKELTFSEFAEFSVHLLDRINLEAYIVGNWDITQALPLADSINNTVYSRSKPCTEVTRRVHKLTSTPQIYHMQTQHQGVCVVNYFQAETINEHSVAQFMLLTELLSPISFQVLRSEKQLGYLVGCAYFPVNRCPGLVIYVQSNSKSLDTIQRHIEQMLKDLPEYMLQLEESDWEQIKQSLIFHLAEKQSSLATSAQNDWMSIGLKDTDFRRQQSICHWIEQMQLDDIKALISHIFCSTEQNKRLILSAAPPDNSGLTSNKAMSSVEIIKHFQNLADPIEI